MIGLRRWCEVILLGLLCGLGSGCFPIAESDSDERKDPYYLAGRRKANGYDYQGAVEAFEKAVEANPRNAAAHFELGVLLEKNFNNYPAAIYHYEKFLQLNPKSPQAQFVTPRIESCKQELAKSVSFGPVTEPMQKELQKLAGENLRLNGQVAALQGQLTQCLAIIAIQSNRLVRAAAPLPGPATNAVPAVRAPPSAIVVPTGFVAQGQAPGPARPGTAPAAPAPAPRKYTVRSGDTLAAIARRYGVDIALLQKANPGLDPRRLKVGQTVQIPAR